MGKLGEIEKADAKEFFLTHRIRPHFLCPWTGTVCVDKLLCIKKDECWRYNQDKTCFLAENSSLSELKEQNNGN